jgi:septal ring factor EnvC (AmiA/AmiB activator)
MIAVQALEKRTAELKQKEARIAVLESKVEELRAKHAYIETVTARLDAYSAEIATDSEANRHAFRRKSAVREVGAERRWDFVHSLRAVWVASHVIISWFF